MPQTIRNGTKFQTEDGYVLTYVQLEHFGFWTDGDLEFEPQDGTSLPLDSEGYLVSGIVLPENQ